MDIFIVVTRSRDGRMIGIARSMPDGKRIPFSGTMELLACIEAICGPGPVANEVGSAESARIGQSGSDDR